MIRNLHSRIIDAKPFFLNNKMAAAFQNFSSIFPRENTKGKIYHNTPVRIRGIIHLKVQWHEIFGPWFVS
jgi:hypothetical protein